MLDHFSVPATSSSAIVTCELNLLASEYAPAGERRAITLSLLSAVESSLGLTTMFALLAALSLMTTAANAVTTDDVKWINQCVADNKCDAPAPVVLKYCTCMNNKMSNNETQSITQWEKTHVAERKACDRESGWK